MTLSFIPRMRILKISLFSILIFTVMSCSNKTVQDPFALNNDVVKLQSQIVDAFEAYSIAAMAKDEDLLHLKRSELNAAAKSNLEAIGKIKSSKSNRTFLQVAKENFQFYEEISTKDLVLIERWFLADSVTVEQNDSLTSLLSKINSRESDLDIKFKSAQSTFAKQNDFQIDE